MCVPEIWNCTLTAMLSMPTFISAVRCDDLRTIVARHQNPDGPGTLTSVWVDLPPETNPALPFEGVWAIRSVSGQADQFTRTDENVFVPMDRDIFMMRLDALALGARIHLYPKEGEQSQCVALSSKKKPA